MDSYSIIDGLVLATSERHVGDGALGAIARLLVLSRILDASNNTRITSLQRVSEGSGTSVDAPTEPELSRTLTA